MKKQSFTILLISVLYTTTAHADWVELGVAVKCDKQNNLFSIRPTVDTSDGEYNVNAPKGFSVLEAGAGQKIQCVIGKTKIEMKINVYGPQSRGMGQGAGVVIIDKLDIGATQIIKNPTNFNWQVTNEKVLTEVTVENESNNIKVVLCRTNGWNWDNPYAEKICETKIIKSNG